MTYYPKRLSGGGDNDIIKVFIISEGRVDADPVFSGHDLKVFNVKARMQNCRISFRFYDITLHISEQISTMT